MIRKHLEKEISLKELKDKFNLEAIINNDKNVSDISSVDEYKDGSITFYTKTSSLKLDKFISDNDIVALIIPKKFEEQVKSKVQNLIIADDVMSVVVKLIDHFYPRVEKRNEISIKADVHETAKIGKNVRIDAYSVISEDVVIEDNVTIMAHTCIYPGVVIKNGSVVHSGVTIREFTEIGKNCVIQNGAIIGADGFGYIPDNKKVIEHVPQVGRVIIKDNVDIGANACIDRGTISDTEIGYHTKLDNLVQLGHNVKIGNASFLCGQVGVAGSVKIGNQVTIGGKVGVADHISIPDKCRFAGGSMVTKTPKEIGDYNGNPAVPVAQFKKQVFYIKKLEKLFKKK